MFILIFYAVSCLLTYQIVITVRFLILKEICNRNKHTDVERVCYCSHKTRLDCPSYSYEMDRCNNYRLFIFGGIWTQQSQNKTMNLKTIKIMSSADVFDAILICELNPSVLFKLKRTTSYVKKRTDWAPSTHKKFFLLKRSITSLAKMIIVTVESWLISMYLSIEKSFWNARYWSLSMPL